jgi:quinolinate synthase
MVQFSPEFDTHSLQEEILRLKSQTGAYLFAHFYQSPEIQAIADVIGDSLELAKTIRKMPEESKIIYATVDFMAECAKVLNPSSHIFLPNRDAQCPMAKFCPPETIKSYRESNPNIPFILYINSITAAKMYADVICTSSSAVQICRSIQKQTGAKKMAMGPDRNLAAWVAAQTGIEIEAVPMDGCCIVHERYESHHIEDFKKQYPEAKIIVHPECPFEVVERADFVGSTNALLNYVQSQKSGIIGIGTEESFIAYAQKHNPSVTCLPIKSNSICRNMKKITLHNIRETLLTLDHAKNEIEIDSDVRTKVLKPLELMFQLMGN